MTMQIQRGRVVTVERGARRQRVPGGGLLASMAVVWKHWQGSFRKNDSFEKIHGTFTMEYPEERPRLPEAFRNMPILLYDEASGHELCTSCFQCQRICPPQVIHMSQAKDPVTGKALPALTEFVIEYDACMSCGLCAEICPFDAIKMDHAFELATSDHAGLTLHREQLNRPISYYEGIAPNMWAEVKDGAFKKLQANIKRRPDVIGMAPNLAEKIAARRRELRPPELVAAPAEEAKDDWSAKDATGVWSAKDATDVWSAKDATDVWSAKDAKPGEGRESSAAAEAPPMAGAPAAPLDDKAARLAAIKAKNAAKKAAEAAQLPPAAPQDE